MLLNLRMVYSTGAVTQRVIKGHQIVVYVQPQLIKMGRPWTPSMIRGSMDPVLIWMDPVHGPGPRRRSMDQGSMFCTFPFSAGCLPFVRINRLGRLLNNGKGFPKIRKQTERNGTYHLLFDFP